MKQLTFLCCACVLTLMLFTGCELGTVETSEAETNESMNSEPVTSKPDSVLRHVVIFKYKEDASPEAIEAINTSFAALQDEIPVVKEFEWGINNSNEKLNQGFTHCYTLTFHSKSDLDDVYIPHKAHQAFVASLGDVLEEAFVLDYWTK